MKKLLCAILALVMLLSLCACGKKDTGATDLTTAPTQAPTENSEETATTDTVATEVPTEGATEEPTAAPTVATSEKATVGSTPKATVTPTTKATAVPTTKATVAPTTKATAAPTTKATVAPTTKATAAPTTKATVAPTTKPATTPATIATTCSHSYKDATCTAPKTCSKCGATEGNAAGHSYSNGTCTVCGAADPNVPFENNSWAAYIVKAGTSEQGEVLSQYILSPTDFQGYTHKEYYSNESYFNVNNGSITYNGKTYYDFWFSSEMNGITWEDNGNTVTVTFAYNEPIIELVLTRTGETQFTVTSSNDTANIPVGTVFKKR